MSGTSSQIGPFGFLNINKPAGPTSHDIVSIVRRVTGERRAGHAGTLDPFAEGVLVVGIGSATRLIEFATASRKTYRAEVTLGISTNTFDLEGTVQAMRSVPQSLDTRQIEEALTVFRGAILQRPPIFSAKKVAGKPAYSRARAGEVLEIAPVQVEIYQLTLLDVRIPKLVLQVECSPGTYIRSIAHELGEELGYGAVLSRLVRLASGDFTLDNALPLATLQEAVSEGTWKQHMLPPETAVSHLPAISLDPDGLLAIYHGRTITFQVGPMEGFARAYSPNGRLVGILKPTEKHDVWRPFKVFVTVIEHELR